MCFARFSESRNGADLDPSILYDVTASETAGPGSQVLINIAVSLRIDLRKLDPAQRLSGSRQLVPGLRTTECTGVSRTSQRLSAARSLVA